MREASPLPTADDNALTLVRERAARRGLALYMNVDERLAEIRADERKIRQVVLNLLSNAIKFTPEGGRIEVAAVPKMAPSKYPSVTPGRHRARGPGSGVRGVPASRDGGEEGGGHGVGADPLPEVPTLCRKFIELHGGTIWVKSQVGVGSTFAFTIPVRCGE